jgi:hypothetical protein
MASFTGLLWRGQLSECAGACGNLCCVCEKLEMYVKGMDNVNEKVTPLLLTRQIKKHTSVSNP